MLINGRFDPLVVPLMPLNSPPRPAIGRLCCTSMGGHNRFAPGPDRQKVVAQLVQFLAGNLG
jgi:hypothetical protein